MNHTSATPEPGRYRIDTGASAITFSTRHLFGLLPVRGTFSIRSGTVDVAEPLTESGVRVEIESAAFRTGDGTRDRAVRSARFLDTARYPVMTFTSRGVALDGTAVDGTLTVCGTARPVSLWIERSAVTPGGFTARATTRLDRTEFGVTAAPGLAGRRLDVALEVTCVRV